jgi:hypothetical protein
MACLMLVGPAGLCLSAEPAAPADGLSGPSSPVPLYSLVNVRLGGEWATAAWKVTPPAGGTFTKQMEDAGKRVVVTGSPGEYLVECTAVHFKLEKLGQYDLRFTIGQGGPGPNPQPGPEPQPAPGPIPAGKLHLVCVVAEIAKQTPQQAAIYANKDLRTLLDSRKDNLRWVDPQHCPADLQPYVAQAVTAGLPRCLVVDASGVNGMIRESTTLADAAATLVLVKKWQGGK